MVVAAKKSNRRNDWNFCADEKAETRFSVRTRWYCLAGANDPGHCFRRSRGTGQAVWCGRGKPVPQADRRGTVDRMCGAAAARREPEFEQFRNKCRNDIRMRVQNVWIKKTTLNSKNETKDANVKGHSHRMMNHIQTDSVKHAAAIAVPAMGGLWTGVAPAAEPGDPNVLAQQSLAATIQKLPLAESQAMARHNNHRRAAPQFAVAGARRSSGRRRRPPLVRPLLKTAWPPRRQISR